MEKAAFNTLLREELEMYLLSVSKNVRTAKRLHHKRYYIWRYLHYFRLAQYYNDQKKSSKGLAHRFYKLLFSIYSRKKNKASIDAGVEIGIQSKIGKCIDIWHSGVVINGNIGDNCVFHGNNIVGNKGLGHEDEWPTLGNGVDVGAGANIIGQVKIADGCIIGAGAVVVKSEEQEGSVLVGIPAKAR